MTRLIMVEVKVVENGDIVEMRARNGADSCVNKGQKLSIEFASLKEERRKVDFRLYLVQ